MNMAFLPKTMDELWTAREEHPHALLFGGGTDLLVRLRSSPQPPPALICIERIEELCQIQEKEGSIFIGAAATHTMIQSNPMIQKTLPILVKAIETLGSPMIRNMGTIGGNICTASPAGDTLPPLYVLDADVEIRSTKESRRIPIVDFIVGPGKTSLREGELLYGVWIKTDHGCAVHHFEKVGQRKALAISIASCAALLNVSGNGIVERIRVAWGSVGPVIVTAPDLEAALRGKPLSRENIKKVIPMVESAISPIDDLRASAAYRRKVAGNLLHRLIEYLHDTH
jgi:CO/xanthine dehydrogenase FAD-binding subunit